MTERGRRRLWLLGASSLFVAILVAMGIALAGSDEGESGTTTGPPEGVRETLALYRGIPQRGIELGDPAAKVTLTEFADLQCPFCGKYGREVLPVIVKRYVRTGRVKLIFRNLTFLGEDSEEAAEMAAAAGRQNKLYEFVDLVYRNQGAEGEGWVDEDYLRRIGTAVGLDVERALAERGHPEVRAQLETAKGAAEGADIEAAPTWLVTRLGRAPERLEPEVLEPEPFGKALDRALAAD
ncbi:MAG: DsbA family protein [Actinomycetota bacterium]|nr:DsbA family protein [Actinomycetota bacterium]